jgi:hypothetical protein
VILETNFDALKEKLGKDKARLVEQNTNDIRTEGSDSRLTTTSRLGHEPPLPLPLPLRRDPNGQRAVVAR